MPSLPATSDGKLLELPRLLVIIPAWNESESVSIVIKNVNEACPYADVLVVDDGSSDDTSTVAAEAHAEVITLPINLGVGGAMRAGFKYARRRKYDFAVQVDADGQHDPAAIPDLLREALNGADVVIGARFAGAGDYSVRGARKWAMRLLSAVIGALGHVRLTDTTSGFKLYSRRALKLFSTSYPVEYLGDTVEALAIAIRSGLIVTQVPVNMNARIAGKPSHSPIQSAVFLFRSVFALAVALISPAQEIDE